MRDIRFTNAPPVKKFVPNFNCKKKFKKELTTKVKIKIKYKNLIRVNFFNCLPNQIEIVFTSSVTCVQ